MNTRPNIGLVDSVHPACTSELEALGFAVRDLSGLPEMLCRSAIAEVEGIVVRSRFPFDRAFFRKNQHLRCIARWGSGLENIDLQAAAEYGIAIVNAPEGNRQAVGEHTLLLLLSMMRHMPRIDREVREAVWKREENRGTELRGKTVGIIGYGNTGSAFARVLAGFQVTVLAYDKYRRNFGDDHIREATMEDIFQRADVVSLHLPLTKETNGMCNTQFFSQFSKPVYFLNTARGPLIQPEALLAALQNGTVIRAGLDVLPFEKPTFEQLDNHPGQQAFLQHPDIIFSPHIAGWSHEANIKTAGIIAEKMHYHFTTNPPRTHNPGSTIPPRS
jgi:D-3-phosphoglycerate dehydrogenase / 2-oxoglutarate reductase